jgi:hypothetical protein
MIIDMKSCFNHFIPVVFIIIIHLIIGTLCVRSCILRVHYLFSNHHQLTTVLVAALRPAINVKNELLIKMTAPASSEAEGEALGADKPADNEDTYIEEIETALLTLFGRILGFIEGKGR